MARKSFKSDSSFSRIAKNSVFTAVKFGTYTLSGVVFIPFLARHFGTGTYGLIALAGFLTQYIGMISNCVGIATARFINIALNQNDWKQANEIFSTTLIANIGSIVLLLPLFSLGIWKLQWIIDFPPEIGADFRILVGCNAAIFFISLITGVFMTPVQAANRVDLSSTVESASICLRMVLLILLVKKVGAYLWLIGIVDIVLALARGGVIYMMCRRLARDLVFKWAHVTGRWVRPVMNMAAWSLVGVLGGSLFLKTDIWMINRFVNKDMAGVYAVLLVWPNFLKQISKQFEAVLTPVYMIDYARGDLGRIARLSFSSAKLLGCLMAIIAGTLFVLSKPILSLWLGHWAVEHATLFRIMITYVVFVVGHEVVWQVYMALNKTHTLGIITLLAGIFNIVLSMSLIALGFGTMGVAWGTVVASVLASSIAVPLGICRLLGIPGHVLIVNHLSACLMLLASLLSAWIALQVGRSSIFASVIIWGVLLLASEGLLFICVFSRDEKNYLLKAARDLAAKYFRPRRSKFDAETSK